MKLANALDDIHAAGGEVVVVNVDPPERNAALAARWHLPFPLVSDPGGDAWLKRFDAFDPDDRGGIAIPVVFVVGPDGSELYRRTSRDFADRQYDEAALAALTDAGLPALDPPPGWWEPAVAAAADPEGVFTAALFGPYFRGAGFSALAISRRVDGVARDEAVAQYEMCVSMGKAWSRRRKLFEGG